MEQDQAVVSSTGIPLQSNCFLVLVDLLPSRLLVPHYFLFRPQVALPVPYVAEKRLSALACTVLVVSVRWSQAARAAREEGREGAMAMTIRFCAGIHHHVHQYHTRNHLRTDNAVHDTLFSPPLVLPFPLPLITSVQFKRSLKLHDPKHMQWRTVVQREARLPAFGIHGVC